MRFDGGGGQAIISRPPLLVLSRIWKWKLLMLIVSLSLQFTVFILKPKIWFIFVHQLYSVGINPTKKKQSIGSNLHFNYPFAWTDETVLYIIAYNFSLFFYLFLISSLGYEYPVLLYTNCNIHIQRKKQEKKIGFFLKTVEGFQKEKETYESWGKLRRFSFNYWSNN